MHAHKETAGCTLQLPGIASPGQEVTWDMRRRLHEVGAHSSLVGIIAPRELGT